MQGSYKYIATAVSIGAISSLDKIICSIGGGQADTRSFCVRELGTIEEYMEYLPITISKKIYQNFHNIKHLILKLENIDIVSEVDCAPSVSLSRDLLHMCNYVENQILQCKRFLIQNIELIHHDVLTKLSASFSDLTAFVENIPSNLDMSVRSNMSRSLCVS
jgi:hypothetical protein